MKLVSPRRGASFYESFSDLIFCTLCLFILIVIFLALQIRKEVESIVEPNKFVGGPDNTLMFSALVNYKGKAHMYFGPADHFNTMTLASRTDEDEAEIVDSLKRGKYLLRPMNEVVNLGFGLGRSLNGQINSSLARLVQGYLHLASNGSTESDRALLNRIKQSYFGSSHDRENQRWLANYGNDWAGRWKEELRKIDENQPEGNFLRFSMVKNADLGTVSDKEWIKKARIKVGQLENITPNELIGLIRSIKPGRGFYLEYVDENGEAVVPPDQVRNLILAVTGYDNRKLSDSGKKVLAEIENEK